ncbi:putative drug exporter of the RND superfamily [Streptomyces noursei]|uniref:Putative conserved membrane protein, MmpL family n=2 Tax=Streptomyces noursei TaxID=1971 RepID=A0A059VWQ1_STRNR|nr:putative drug exporter of the RND superfamily [Streptomyces noursei]GCB89073.1 putative conserved membrane protein, MmpL family [Streptomyces noursei]
MGRGMKQSITRGAALVVVLLAAFACLPLTAVTGARTSSAGYADESSESYRADRALEEGYGWGSPQVQMELRPSVPVDSAEATAVGRRLTDQVAHSPGVARALSWWTVKDKRLRSGDGRAVLLVARLTGDNARVEATAARLADRFGGQRFPFDITVTGRGPVNRDLAERSRQELLHAEQISVPLVALVLLFAFRTVVAAAVPLAIGVTSIAGTQIVLYGLTKVMEVSVFAPNIAVALALGLSVDYAMILVSRFREERAAGLDVQRAVGATLRTAGRTVLCSAAVVSLSLSVLLLFPIPFLRSLGAATVSVAVLAAITALVLVPLMLTAVGEHLERGPVPGLKHLTGQESAQRRGAWAAFTRWVPRRPVLALGASTAILVLLALPFARAEWGFIDERWLPSGSPQRAAAARVRAEFPLAAGVVPLVLLDRAPAGSTTAVRFAAALSKDPRLVSVSGPTGVFADGRRLAGPSSAQAPEGASRPAGTWFEITSRLADPASGQAKNLVHDLRGLQVPGGARVAGETALLVDTEHLLGKVAFRAAGTIAAVTGLMLFVYLRSVFIPVKALATNLLSMTAGFGAMVFLFQEGHLAQWLGGTATTFTDPLLPPLMFCIVFGLSMDYEVFMVARIREEYLRTGDNRAAITTGLQRTGRLITASCLALIAAVAPLTLSSLAVMQLVGTVLIISIVVDATVVRCLLVPAAMSLAGRWNWWSPLDRGDSHAASLSAAPTLQD